MDCCYDWQRSSEILREPDYLKFLAEAEKEAVDPDQYLDMNDVDECGRDQEVYVRLQSFLMRSQLNLLEMRRLTRCSVLAARVQMSRSGRNPTSKII